MTEELRKIYDKALDDQPQATDQVREAYRNLGYALDRYIEAMQEYEFAWAYELGRKAGAVE